MSTIEKCKEPRCPYCDSHVVADGVFDWHCSQCTWFGVSPAYAPPEPETITHDCHYVEDGWSVQMPGEAQRVGVSGQEYLDAQREMNRKMSVQAEMLLRDNARMRMSGTDLAEAALRVCRTYDGTHRLALAVARWVEAIADEGGRPHD